MQTGLASVLDGDRTQDALSDNIGSLPRICDIFGETQDSIESCPRVNNDWDAWLS